MVQRGASPRAAATAYGIGQHHMRRLIREGAVTPRAIGRRSIVLFSEVEDALRNLPRTKSSNWSHQDGKPLAIKLKLVERMES
jgi:hypothetical protein